MAGIVVSREPVVFKESEFWVVEEVDLVVEAVVVVDVVVVVVLDPIQRGLEALETQCGGAVAWGLRHRLTVVAIGLVVLIGGGGLYNFIGSEMMPLADVGQAYGAIEAKPGTSFARTQQMVRNIEGYVASLPEVDRVSTKVGVEPGGVYYTGYSVDMASSASMMITFKDKDDRQRSIFELIDTIQAEALSRFPEDLRRVQIKEMGSDVMATSQAPISLMVHGKDLSVLNQMGLQLLELTKDIPGLAQPALDWTLGLPEKRLKVNFEKAQEFGLTPKMIAQQLYYSLRGGYTEEYYRLPNIRQNTVQVRYPNDQRRANGMDLEQVYLTNAQGQSVPLKSIATIKKRQAPTLIAHDGMRRVITLLGFYRPDGPPSMDLTMEAINRAVSKMNFPPGYGLEIRGDMTQMMDSFKSLLNGLIVAIILMYLVLVAQFRGWLQPLQMILSLPMMVTGVFLGLFIMGQAFSTVSIMALIVLSGMNITTAILMIDQINRYREEGMPRKEAIEKGATARLRPILMTSLTTCIVMVPVSMFPKTGMDAYAPLGTVVLWGLLSGTLLSLLVVPVMHSLVDDAIDWIQEKKHQVFRGTKP